MIDVSLIAISDPSVIKVDKKEVMRYLGVKESNEATDELYNQCVNEIYDYLEPRATYTKVEIQNQNNEIDFGFMKVNSKKLAKNLLDCQEAYLFCATLGIKLDRYFERLNRISKAKAMVFSAVASSLIESFCDYVNEFLANGKKTKPRFSAGYGDFSLLHQKDILGALDANKRLGVCLTDSYMMIPVKTVTAVIGIRR